MYIKNTGESSSKLGNCEICEKHVSEVWMRRIGAYYIFGHRECLIGGEKVVLERAKQTKEKNYK